MRRAMKRLFAKLERRNVYEVRPRADKRRARLRIGIRHPLLKSPTNSNPDPESSLLPCRLLPISRTTALHTDRSLVGIRAS